MLKDQMVLKEPKWVEMEDLINRIGALHGELLSMQKEVIRRFPIERTFPSGLEATETTKRVEAAFLAAIGKGDAPEKSLVELAEHDSELVESLETSLGGMWRE